jgi:hypothetical protein
VPRGIIKVTDNQSELVAAAELLDWRSVFFCDRD